MSSFVGKRKAESQWPSEVPFYAIPDNFLEALKDGRHIDEDSCISRAFYHDALKNDIP